MNHMLSKIVGVLSLIISAPFVVWAIINPPILVMVILIGAMCLCVYGGCRS